MAGLGPMGILGRQLFALLNRRSEPTKRPAATNSAHPLASRGRSTQPSVVRRAEEGLGGLWDDDQTVLGMTMGQTGIPNWVASGRRRPT